MPVTAIIGAAAIGGAATVYSSGQATKAAKTANNQNQATIAKTQADNNALLAPYVATGVKSVDAIEDFLGLNGSTDQDQAFTNWRKATGYQFTLDQGLDSINSNAAAAGSLNSGAAAKAEMKYAAGLADTTGQTYLGNLQTQQGIGASAAGANASANSSAAGASINSTNALAGAKADNATTTGNAFNSFLSDAVSAYGLSSGAKKTDSSYKPPVKNAMAAARNWG